MTARERYQSIYPLFTDGLRLAPGELIMARAPMRWMLSGWRDVPRGGGGDCTNVALTACAFTSLRRGPRPDRLYLMAPDVDLDLTLKAEELARPPEPGEPHGVLRALLYAAGAPPGLELRCTAKGIPAATGLGTSAALQVTIVSVLAAAAGRQLSPIELIHAARLPETYVLGLSCGFQDQAAAVNGGIANYFTRFDDGAEEVEIRPLAVDPNLVQTIEAGMIVVDFGTPHSSHAAHMDVFERLEAGRSDSRRAFELLAEAERGAQDALVRGSFDDLAEALNHTWTAQRLLHPAMILPIMHDVVAMARGLGVRAANVNGAGMGGTVTLLAEPDAVGWVVRALDRLAGVRVLPCDINRHGVVCWRQQPPAGDAS
jgi:D-glycero-alpha-D-manno-heptose-7-phosphate kinase